MIVPGLPTPLSVSGLTLILSADELDVDVFAQLGSPSGSVTVSVVVMPTVKIGASSTAAAALIFSGFDSGVSITIDNRGRIAGAGGSGGRGGDGAGGNSAGFRGAGGGGGAGNTPGAGGDATPNATVGSPGTATAGGANGVSSFQAGTPSINTESGFDAGDAISHGAFDLKIENGSGEIWGGGGGGMGGFDLNPGEDGGVGGAPGKDAPFVLILGQGSGGNALRGTGTITWLSGSGSPNVEGSVGA